MKSCRQCSNWVDLDKDAMFLAVRKADPWSGLESVIGVAKANGKLFACFDLIKLYIEFLDEDEKVTIFSNFVHECEADYVFNTRQSSLLLLYSRLWFADMLQGLSEVQKANEELDKARNELSTLPWILKGDTPHLQFKILLMFSTMSDGFALAAQLSELATTLSTSEDRLLESQILVHGMTALNQISHSRRYQSWYDLNERLFVRYSKLHENNQGRAALVAFKIWTLKNAGDFNDQSKGREYLHELTRFQKLYPRFDVPTILRDFYFRAAESLRLLGSREEAKEFDKKTALALRDCPTDPSQFFRVYRGKPPDEWSPHLLDIMLPWIKADLAAAKLSADRIALMLNVTASESSSNVTLALSQVLEALQRPGEAFVGKIFGSPIPISCEAWEVRLKRFEEWLWDSPSNVDRYIRHTILGDLQQARCASVQKYVVQVTNKAAHLFSKDPAKITMDDLIKEHNEDLQMDVRLMNSNEIMRLIELRSRLDRKAMGTSETQAFVDRWTLMCERSQLATSLKAFRTGVIQDHDLADAQAWFEEIYPQLNTNNTLQRLATLQLISMCQKQRHTMFGTIASDAALKTYDLYDQLYTEQRVARSVLRGAESVTARTEIEVTWGFTKHYNFAMGACVEAIGVGQQRNNHHRHFHQDLHYIPTAPPSPSRSMKTLFTNLIDWAQKKKARSITEALGAEVIVSHNVLSDASIQDEALMLLKREAEFQKEINDGNGDVLELSRALDLIRQEMRMCPSLKKVMDLRDGQALTESQIQLLAAELGENVVIVDFTYLPTSYTGLASEIILMIYKKGRLVSAFFVTPELRQARIKAWVDVFLDQEKILSNNRPVLNHLYPLIEAAVKFSSPGDPIVLCPTDVLFNIPLHAIELLDGMPWIQRNPIIYTQALSILRLCHHAASAREPDTSIKPLAVQALSAEDMDHPGAANMAFVSRSNARLLQGESLTKKSFLAACAESELINFYGHISFDPGRPLDHYLAIRKLEAERVTVRDLFDLRLRPGTHINLVGCQSGRTKVGINDDHLGLSTALFFAGAASVVTTLWSIDMADGGAFQEAFFSELLAQSRHSESKAQQGDSYEPGNGYRRSFLDLAKALQVAVLHISVDSTGQRKAPYHWAAFTLQGSWNKFPLLQVNSKDKEEII